LALLHDPEYEQGEQTPNIISSRKVVSIKQTKVTKIAAMLHLTYQACEETLKQPPIFSRTARLTTIGSKAQERS
jgi:hypothetical protein